MRFRRPRGLTVLVGALAFLLVVEAGLVVSLFVWPDAAPGVRSLVADVGRSWAGSPESPGLPARAAAAVNSVYREWIVPLWSLSTSEEWEPEFVKCISCHRDYASRRLFPSVYMNHPLHAQLRVDCATCHKETTHPDPPPPKEAVCATCHAEVQQQDGCILCHPPASLPHFYLLGAPREGPVQCDSCHPKGSFSSSASKSLVHERALDGSNRKVCVSCHEPSTCQQCHASRHPPDWVKTHGPEAGLGGATACFSCHTSTWCADRCHSVTPTQPFTPKPLPRPSGGEG